MDGRRAPVRLPIQMVRLGLVLAGLLGCGDNMTPPPNDLVGDLAVEHVGTLATGNVRSIALAGVDATRFFVARATTQGAVASILFGIGVWLLFLALPWGTAFPAQLAGVLASFAGMVAGSLAPQWVANTRTPHRLLATEPA